MGPAPRECPAMHPPQLHFHSQNSEKQRVQAVATCNLEGSAAVQQQSCPGFDSQQIENSSQRCRQHATFQFRRQCTCQRHMIQFEQALSRLLICSSRDWQLGASPRRQRAMERQQSKVTLGKERMADTDLAAWAAMHLAAGSQHHQSTCEPLACHSV